MLTMMESNIGYGARSSPVVAACVKNREVYNHAPVMSYTQMLRMSLEEDAAEDMGSSIIGREAFNYLEGGSARDHHEVKEEMLRRDEEGYAESDYDFTCLTLGRQARPHQQEQGPCSSIGAAPTAGAAASNTNRSNGFTRTCTLCGTSKTPLWRSGPMGAKSLCNACGIRSKKAKKLAAASNAQQQQDEEEDLVIASNICKQQIIRQKKGVMNWKAGGTKKAAAALKRKNMASCCATSTSKEAGYSNVECMEGSRKLQQDQMMIKKKMKKHQQRMLLPTTACKQPRLYVNVNSSPVKTEASSCVTSRGTPSPCSTERKPLSPHFPASSFTAHHSNIHLDDAHFPKDEEQAAILLMALSCGLVLAN